ncbi:MAG: DUF1501 domain-containing protein [Gammaproteobacteria bacterium]|nr:DUF1501 domain-containing protein [Gammaproteobacteria bacterium]
MENLPRRRFLHLALATSGLLATRLSFAGGPRGERRLVLVVLRGALDGLAAVPPYADPDYARVRGEAALAAPGGAQGALPLDGFFGLHPALGFLGRCYAARELTVLHALATPYRERSHFDGQDVLENGSPRPHALQSGWLNRALASLPAPGARATGVALGQNVPLVMRGPAEVASWSASRMAALDEETLQRITDLYASDTLLAGRFAEALSTQALAETMPAEAPGPPDYAARYAQVVRAAAGFLRQPAGPRVAVFDTTGWDTHANEGAAEGQLAGRLRALDGGLALLREELGPVWADTAVLLVTEFGRTAAVNGTRGTDHGTGAAAFLVGGAVAGGRVVADWPGLAPRALYEGRDLRPTLDLRAVLKGLLAEGLGVSPRALESDVFPDSTAARALPGLLRG